MLFPLSEDKRVRRALHSIRTTIEGLMINRILQLDLLLVLLLIPTVAVDHKAKALFTPKIPINLVT